MCILFGNIKVVHGSKLGSIYSVSADDYVNCSFSHDNGVEGRLDVNWCKADYRKAFNELIIKGERGELRVNKQQIKLTTTVDNPNIGIKPGTNEIFVTDDLQNTEFYLRGEDFSGQLIEFGNSILGAITSNNAADFESSSHVDFIIDQIRSIKMTELILGDNQFLGVNHRSEELGGKAPQNLVISPKYSTFLLSAKILVFHPLCLQLMKKSYRF